uniref:Reverse transcriptase domain-containing protein n=1 Tax=Lactuca sativa TaxID=4236 RepID=A0A9R1WF70_LACSA|nr:hypothetical protein LSAT_V11C200050910 [Lactuca sativa]
MSKKDEEKTAFYTDHDTFCYTKMPFGLKNAGETYQRLVESIFSNKIGRNIVVYVNDMVIKSPDEAKMLRDIEETFKTLEKVKMKLNPGKCTFGVDEGIPLNLKRGHILRVGCRKGGGIEVDIFHQLAFQGLELNYPALEKLVLALIYAARRLRRYFQAHQIEVLTNCPIKQILLNPETSGLLAKWAIEFGEHDISYRPRTSIKGMRSQISCSESPEGGI